MRILYLDLDTLRPDHLGCYGYERNTSPNLDRIAAEGVRFTNYYATDVPCLPSRAALFSGRFGIHTGIVGHGGTAADPRIQGYSRGFRTAASATAWISVMRRAGLRTVTVSPFAERHSAWWFYTGFLEMFNPGRGGLDLADEVVPIALDWLERNAEQDNWFLHVNLWDPHTPYDAPDEFGNPFKDDPPPSWLTEEILERHRLSYGPHSAREPIGWDEPEKPPTPRMPTTIANLDDYKRWIDGYDVGIRYADDRIGRIFDLLTKKGLMDDLIVIISGDHAENQGELNVYGDHQTADYFTNRVPLIIRWPGMKGGGAVDEALHYNVDLPPTMADLLGQESPKVWDGKSFAQTIRDGSRAGHDYLVLSQCAWSCQRSVRFGPWIMIRTYHDGLKEFPSRMLFNLQDDPHETNNLAEKHPHVVARAHAMLDEWHTEMMASSDSPVDPLWTVMHEGGAFHTRDMVEKYCERLRATGRWHHAERLERMHGKR